MHLNEKVQKIFGHLHTILIWTKSKRTVTFFRETFPNRTYIRCIILPKAQRHLDLHSDRPHERRKEKRKSRLLPSIYPQSDQALPNAIEDPMKIDAPDELLQSDKWIFSDNVRKSGKMESPGAWGQSLCNIC